MAKNLLHQVMLKKDDAATSKPSFLDKDALIEKIKSDFEREREIEEKKKEVIEEKKIEEFQEKVLESVKELTEMSQNIVKKRGRPPKV